MSPPIRSQILAISLMKLIFVDSKALATYFVSSALSGDITSFDDLQGKVQPSS